MFSLNNELAEDIHLSISKTVLKEIQNYFETANFEDVDYNDNIKSPQMMTIIIVAYWRSGSSFLGDLLQQNKNTYYSFEPLRMITVTDGNYIPVVNLSNAFDFLNHVLSCNFKAIAEYEKVVRKLYFFERNKFLQLYCKLMKANDTSEIMEKVCSMSKLHIIKLIRLTLKQVFQFMETLKNKETVKIVHLVRDPRAMFNSRFQLDWCMNDECGDIKTTCGLMAENFETFNEMKKRFPYNVFQIKFEHLALDTINSSNELFK
ncbi:secreted protein-like protein [Leptotrombidium deliense]|uniref:Secreted protein-like protein n=1 Tax=Leptotrombidium deliense TaxID=299467 RepID=A0A443RYM5_9ACAR|nr:secreted protein-like protein [Leptotrombidium deliense]